MPPIFYNTPVETLPRLGTTLGIDLRIKRDDLLPLPGGGNKVRKVARIFGDSVEAGVDTVVTHGGIQSNHARVTAIEAVKRGLQCVLVLHGDEDRAGLTGNYRLAELTGAEIHVVPYERLWAAVQDCMAGLHAAGAHAFLIPGGGHCLAGASAYADAVDELRGQLPAAWIPDFIVHASGTGATQSGILAGVERAGWPTAVMGISVGRTRDRGGQIVLESYRELREHLGLAGVERGVYFRDDWLCGGYGRHDHRVAAIIRQAGREEGLILDATYTGKAFLGLVELVRSGDIPRGSRVLFWHTGGLLNLMAEGFGDSPAAMEPEVNR